MVSKLNNVVPPEGSGVFSEGSSLTFLLSSVPFVDSLGSPGNSEVLSEDIERSFLVAQDLPKIVNYSRCTIQYAPRVVEHILNIVRYSF